MGYTRQGVAIGIAMMALVALDKGSVIRFLCWIAVAALFHKSAVILVPLAILANTKRKLWMFLWIGIVGSTLFVLLLQESLDFLTYSYLEQDRYESSGAAIRIGMNALPGLIFLIFHHRFAMSIAQKRLWMWIAAIALVFVGLLYVSPSSTAVDRVALYLIPLQLFVLSRIPLAIGNSFGGKYVWVCLMVAYSATVQTVWLLMGDMANSWLPYRFYLWELIWQ
jgi:hypothetical protein